MTSLKVKYKNLREGALSAEQVESKFGWIRTLLWVLAFLIGLSRVVLGVHSWNQVLLGFAIGILVKDWFNEEVWRNCLLWVGLKAKMGKHTVLKLALVIKVTSMAACYGLLKLAYNRPEPKDPPLWDKCPNCQKSFLPDSMASLGSLSMISGLLVGLYLNSLIKERS